MTVELRRPRAAYDPATVRVLALSFAMYAVAVGVSIGGLPHLSSYGLNGFWPWLLIAASCAVAELVAVHMHVGRQTLTYTLSDVPIVVGLVFLDPMALVLARAAGAGLVIVVGRWRRPVKLLFNLANMLLETALAALVWHLVLAGNDPIGPLMWLAALAVLVTTEVSSGAAVAAAIRLHEGRIERQTLPQFLIGTVVAVANISLAVLVVILVHFEWRAMWALGVLGVALALAYRSHSALRRRHESLEQLAGSTSDTTGDLKPDAVADAIVRRAAELVSADLVELDWWGDQETPPLRLVHRAGEPVSSPPVGAALGRPAAQPLLLRRGERNRERRELLRAAGLREAIVAPLTSSGRVIGTLTVGDRQGDIATFDDEDSSMVLALANHAVVALSNAQLVGRLRVEADERRHEALHDALTGLPNRSMFRQRLAERLRCDERFAVLLLDLDRFKEVNDTLGHHLGDELLKLVGSRLLRAVPSNAVVARQGGDEFTILLPNVEEGEAALVATGLRAALLQPFDVGKLTLNVDCSVGIALSPQQGHDLDVLIQRADVAMYTAKADHSGFAFYSSDRDPYSPRRLVLAADLRETVTSGALRVNYQPQVDLRDSRATSVEALVRWHHPQYGFIPPDDFLPIAEQTDLMLPLTVFVLRQALADTASWERAGITVSVAVNLSPRILLEPQLIDLVATALADSGLPASRLTLEITEGSIIADPARATAVLEQLGAMGVRLSIDDFGTGYSSLAYLGRLPVHEVKIDKSFVLTLSDGTNAAIVASTVDLAHRLRMDVVAEGVETAEAYATLLRMGCDLAQGYLMSKPLAAAALLDWARSWPSTAPSILSPLHGDVTPAEDAFPPRVRLLRQPS